METWTDVQHNIVFTDTFPDDVCGPRVTLTLREGLWTQVAEFTSGVPETGDQGRYRFENGNLVLTSTSPGCTGCVGVLDWQFDGRKLSLRFDDSKRHPDIERLMTEHVCTRTG